MRFLLIPVAFRPSAHTATWVALGVAVVALGFALAAFSMALVLLEGRV